ncbi:MAG: hypothetical protein Q9200_000196 [Gallowayella weberi]
MCFGQATSRQSQSTLSTFNQPSAAARSSQGAFHNKQAHAKCGGALSFPSYRYWFYWGWEDALRAFDPIAQCEAVVRYAKRFMINLYILPNQLEIQQGHDKKGPPPPERFPRKLLEVLTRLANVEHLILILPEYHTKVFKNTFNKSNPSFPNVRTLVLGMHMDWIIAMCPNVTTILGHTMYGGFSRPNGANLIKFAGQAKTLRHFEMEQWWSREHLQDVYEVMPMIQSLALTFGASPYGLEGLLPTLSRFKNLMSLVLVDATWLLVVFGSPGLPEAYMGPGGEELALQIETDRNRAEETVARMVFVNVPKLEELWVGEHSKANIIRTDTGKVGQISWTDDSRQKAYMPDFWDR